MSPKGIKTSTSNREPCSYTSLVFFFFFFFVEFESLLYELWSVLCCTSALTQQLIHLANWDIQALYTLYANFSQFMETPIILLVDYAVNHVVSHTETSVMVLMWIVNGCGFFFPLLCL